MSFSCGRPSVAQILWSVGFAVSLIGGVWTLKRYELGIVERSIIALLPLVTGGGYIWAMVTGMRRLDELQRRIWLEAVSLAFACTLVILFCEPVLRKAGLAVSVDLLAPTMAMLMVLAKWFFERRYR